MKLPDFLSPPLLPKTVASGKPVSDECEVHQKLGGLNIIYFITIQNYLPLKIIWCNIFYYFDKVVH